MIEEAIKHAYEKFDSVLNGIAESTALCLIRDLHHLIAEYCVEPRQEFEKYLHVHFKAFNDKTGCSGSALSKLRIELQSSNHKLASLYLSQVQELYLDSYYESQCENQDEVIECKLQGEFYSVSEDCRRIECLSPRCCCGDPVIVKCPEWI